MSNQDELKDEPITQPEVEEVFDPDRALRTMAKQVAALFHQLPELMATMKAVVAQQQEHERRIIRLEGHVEDLREKVRIGSLPTVAPVPPQL